MFNPYYLLRPSVVLRILLTATDRIKSLLSRVFLSCLFISLQEVTLYSLLVVGYKSQVDLLLFLLVAFDVTYAAAKIPLVFSSVVSVSAFDRLQLSLQLPL